MVDGSVGRVPPHNLEAEQSLLGAVLVDQEALLKIADAVRSDDFYKDAHRIMFETMLELAERHQPIDILTVGNRLEERSMLKQVGGRTALVELTNVVATAAHIAHYAEIITKKATLRRLLRAAAEIAELGYDATGKVNTDLFYEGKAYMEFPTAAAVMELLDRTDVCKAYWS